MLCNSCVCADVCEGTRQHGVDGKREREGRECLLASGECAEGDIAAGPCEGGERERERCLC